jgi:Ca-activated chloride channel family protein
MIEFSLPWALALLPLPLLAYWLLPRAGAGRGAALRLPFYDAVAGRAGGSAGSRSTRLGIVAIKAIAYGLLVLAAAGPRWVGEPQPIPTRGRDLMLALDLSASMQQRDFEWQGRAIDRFSVVDAVARDFVAKRKGDRVGLILFGSRAYLQSPLTRDNETVIAMLADSEVGLAGEDTAIGDAIGIAVKHLRDRPTDERVLVLLSDGANTAGVADPLDAARLAADEGIRIYTIGVGSNATRVRTPFGLQALMGHSDLDEKSLREIASLTGGEYFQAGDTQSLISVYERIDAMEPTLGETESVRPIRSLFQWPLAGAAVLASGLLLASAARLGMGGRARPSTIERTA